ncbi:MAG: hypothetical protein JJT89_06565 [Nitriliruptoraceae bacterium]|nr:hypothetical protein [Nitriliruptoraceae bacterium]
MTTLAQALGVDFVETLPPVKRCEQCDAIADYLIRDAGDVSTWCHSCIADAVEVSA